MKLSCRVLLLLAFLAQYVQGEEPHEFLRGEWKIIPTLSKKDSDAQKRKAKAPIKGSAKITRDVWITLFNGEEFGRKAYEIDGVVDGLIRIVVTEYIWAQGEPKPLDNDPFTDPNKEDKMDRFLIQKKGQDSFILLFCHENWEVRNIPAPTYQRSKLTNAEQEDKANR